MHAAKSTLVAFILTFLTILSFPQIARAELVTGKDWIGMFPVGSEDLRSNATSWKYVNCLSTSGSPYLSGSCTGSTNGFPRPSVAGAYEIRMMANDSCQNATNCTRLATSDPGWVQFSLDTPTLACTANPTVTLSWPTLNGVSLIDVYQNGELLDDFIDIPYATSVIVPISPATAYTFSITAKNGKGSNGSLNSVSIANTDCVPPTLSATSALTVTNDGNRTITPTLAGRGTGKVTAQSGSAWFNPIKVTLAASPGTNDISTYYTAFYDKSLTTTPYTSIIGSDGNPIDTVAIPLKTTLQNNPNAGFFLKYDVTLSKSYVWDPGTGSWVDLSDYPSGLQICPVGGCIGGISNYYVVYPVSSALNWKIQFDQTFQSKDMYTAVYVVDTGGLTAFSGDTNPTIVP